jgi:protein-S-isoprenylcysteine O-methyltransferase Ste14
MLGVFYAQGAMGSSWRIGVDESERTDLVTGGPFRFVRNPIYTATIPSMAALVLILGNVCAIAAFAVNFIGLEIQVRLSEEPHMLRTHGDTYRTWASQTGRFLPGIGRLR